MESLDDNIQKLAVFIDLGPSMASTLKRLIQAIADKKNEMKEKRLDSTTAEFLRPFTRELEKIDEQFSHARKTTEELPSFYVTANLML